MATVETFTILICDLVGSAGLESRTGPGAAHELRTQYFSLLEGAVGYTGGRQIKNTGDGALAAFASGSQAVACIGRDVERERLASSHTGRQRALELSREHGCALFEPHAATIAEAGSPSGT